MHVTAAHHISSPTPWGQAWHTSWWPLATLHCDTNFGALSQAVIHGWLNMQKPQDVFFFWATLQLYTELQHVELLFLCRVCSNTKAN